MGGNQSTHRKATPTQTCKLPMESRSWIITEATRELVNLLQVYLKYSSYHFTSLLVSALHSPFLYLLVSYKTAYMTSNNNNKTLKKKTERPEIMRGDEKKKPKRKAKSLSKGPLFLWAPLIMSVLHSALKPSALPHFHQMTHSSTSRPAVP